MPAVPLEERFDSALLAYLRMRYRAGVRELDAVEKDLAATEEKRQCLTMELAELARLLNIDRKTEKR